MRFFNLGADIQRNQNYIFQDIPDIKCQKIRPLIIDQKYDKVSACANKQFC